MAVESKNKINHISAYSSVRPNTPSSSASLSKMTPVIVPKKRDLSFLCTPEFNRAVSDRCRALFNMNLKEKFISPNMTVSDFHKRVEGISKISAYIAKDSVLSSLGIEYNDIVEALKFSSKHNIPIDYNFDSRINALENLSSMGANPQNNKIFKKIGQELLKGIIVYNEDNVSVFDELSLENMRKLMRSRTLAPVRKKMDSDLIISFLKSKDSSVIVKENIEKLEAILKNQEYSFLKDCPSLKPSLLLYGGDLNKFMSKVKEIHSSLGKNQKLLFSLNPETNVVFIKSRNIYEGGLETAVSQRYDKAFNLVAEERSISGLNSAGKKTLNAYIMDKTGHAEYNIRQIYDKVHKSWILTDWIKRIKNQQGKVVETEVLQLSNVAGVYNIKKIDANRKIQTLSSAVKNNKGTIIEKKLVSPLGDRTFYKFFKSSDGKREQFSYVIKDKDGKVLASKESLFRRLSSSLALSVVNGEKYKIEYFKDEIHIFDEKNAQKTVLDLRKLVAKGQKSHLGLLKKLSAPELIAVSKNAKYLDSIKEKDSYYLIGADEIACSANRFVFEHELGHAKDSAVESFQSVINDGKKSVLEMKRKFTSDIKLQKIFKAEKNRFMKAYPLKIRHIAGYFVNENINSPLIKGLSEAVAEINAIINSPYPPKWIMGRGHLLQENFPRTIAYLLKKYKL
ncbi:MAG: hypothetical protein KHX03_02490 [Clostridium sp.]|nr:hypothetical protein [Clostridium sp.]